MLQALSNRWWFFLVRGIAAVVFGIFAFARPGMTLLTLVIVFAAYAFVDGIFALVAASTGVAGSRWWVLLLEGMLGIVFAFLMWTFPGITAVAFVYAVAAWAIFTGIAEVLFGIQLRDVIENEWLYVLSGIVSVAFGIWIVRNPAAGALAVLWLIGLYAVVFGVIQIGMSLRLHALLGALKPAAHP